MLFPSDACYLNIARFHTIIYRTATRCLALFASLDDCFLQRKIVNHVAIKTGFSRELQMFDAHHSLNLLNRAR